MWKTLPSTYFESSVAVNMLFATLYVHFWQALTTSVPGTRHVQSTCELLSSTALSRPLSKLPFLPTFPRERLPLQQASAPNSAACQLSLLRAGSGPGPRRVGGCGGQTAGRLAQPAPRCAARAMFVQGKPQKQSAVRREAGRAKHPQ